MELRITRARGSLVKQFLRYHVEPRDSSEFYGNTGVLEFKSGEQEIVITLLTRLDGIPEVCNFLCHVRWHEVDVWHIMGHACSKHEP